ncbi:hypothetical protein ACONUD_04445 [Microbulbifer harenosus]|uniref:Uncharacterized protein n=1 Tax=Microbulbifer harenosus TaxID=2576840 RepID=A0ABY2UKD9_9GAMM|nr:hypothetical protein [Microbulbifer harenosus]TLM78613.1 hypothetical protein FDY93_04940 [Microbulbifer harenosus]
MTTVRAFQTISFCCLLLTGGAVFAQTPVDPMGGMGEKLAKLGGQMHVAAKKCGGYTEEQLEKMKAEQRKNSANLAMTEEAFDKAFAEGERLLEERWKNMSSAERAAACEEMKSVPDGM